MTRRRTIGDNPLDSITEPVRPSGKRSEERAAYAPAKTAAPPTEEATAGQAATGFWKWKAPKLVHHSIIQLVGGDVLPWVTRLTPQHPDASRGFRLMGGEFIEIKRDVVRVVIESAETVRKTGKLFFWATVGAFAAGPLGALAGSLYGGRARRFTYFELQLADGRRVKAVAHPETVADIQAEIG